MHQNDDMAPENDAFQSLNSASGCPPSSHFIQASCPFINAEWGKLGAVSFE